MRRLCGALSAAIALIALMLSGSVSAQAGDPTYPYPVLYGSHKVSYWFYYQGLPYAASQGNTCRGQLTDHKLMAMMLAITWHEASDRTHTPAPMTLSRADELQTMYYDSNVNTAYPRDFYHPGIGLWQFDDRGMGRKMAISKFDTTLAAVSLARELSGRWCQRPGNFDYLYVSAPNGAWYGCKPNGQPCKDDFDAIYNGANDSLTDIGTNVNVQNLGGMQYRKCSIYGQAGQFDCIYVKPGFSQGDDSWKADPTGNLSDRSPLSRPFYVFKTRQGDTRFETRVWLKTDSGKKADGTYRYDSSIMVRRSFQKTSSQDMVWEKSPGLCDVKYQLGRC